MNIPRVLREQLKLYERHGFHAVSVEPRAGSHFKVLFAEFNEPQFLTKNTGDPRGLRNNIARFRALAAKETV
jgi:hypothetical protein